jgi:tetratricopeptide (TPR) repeat protein
MGLIFQEIGHLTKSYDGTIERFFGDEALLLFGVPRAHEDDPIRAIRVAEGIHELIGQQSARFVDKIRRPLAMHIGINTGLVITGDEYIDKGRHGLTGDAVNLAARLTKRSKSGETLVGPETYRQARHHFEFEALGPIEVKGKADPIQVYKVLSPKEQPSTLHRTHGARADLIGRDKEIAILMKEAEQLDQGRSAIISICGDAGTGKSRLTREFKARLDLNKIQWYEGHAYGYTQNTPYYPLIDLLTHAFGIEEGDSSARIREKIESGVAYLLGTENQAAAYIGGLFSLSYPEVVQVSPEFWKSRLHESIKEIVSALAERRPTVICFEDLHWADPSFIELLGSLLKNPADSILFVCVYRPSLSLFDGQNPERFDPAYQEIRLQELSAYDAQAMLRSLLKSEDIPAELTDFIEKKAEGNPFYLEEVINSLIESDILTRDNGSCKLTRAIEEADIPSSINGVLTSRIDRLQKESKMILQEASVIGRAFFYEILKRITDLKTPIDKYLAGLEQLDLIRVRVLEPDLEYIFKHALTQEVVYNGILKKERQEIHERIGLAIEALFKDRLSEFYETLAFHFSHSRSVVKAVNYLIMSGEKNLQRYALDEAHKFYDGAYKMLSEKSSLTIDEKRLLIDLLIKWSFAFIYRADFERLKTVLEVHRDLVDSLEDKERQGMFYTCLGFAFGQTGRSRESYEYLHKSLKWCQEANNEKFAAYCYAWLSQTCQELGLLDDAIVFGKKGQTIAGRLAWDPLLFSHTNSWTAVAYFYRGECAEIEKISNAHLEKGRANSDTRLIIEASLFMGMMFLAGGDYTNCIKKMEKTNRRTKDPIVLYNGKLMLGMCYLPLGKLKEAEDALNETLDQTRHIQSWVRKHQSEMFLTAVLAARGNLSGGIKNLHRLQAYFSENSQKWSAVTVEYILGNIYFQLIQNEAPKDFKIIIKNIGFLIKTLPFAAKKSERHYLAAIQAAKEINAKGILAQSCLDLGLLYKIKKRNDEARQYISNAVKIFEECGAYAFLEQAKQALESLS